MLFASSHPLRSGQMDCSNCHVPHGSNHRNLLQARTPFLCQQCHLAPFHPSNAETGLGIPPGGVHLPICWADNAPTVMCRYTDPTIHPAQG